MPDYTQYNIPDLGGLLDAFLQAQRDRIGMSGTQIAESFDFRDTEAMGKLFDPIDTSYIEEGLSKLPELQQFLHNNAAQGYIGNMNQLNSRIGRTGMAGMGTGQFTDIINTDYSKRMLGADKEIMGLVGEYRGLLGEQFQQQTQMAQSMVAGGAEVATPWKTEWKKYKELMWR